MDGAPIFACFYRLACLQASHSSLIVFRIYHPILRGKWYIITSNLSQCSPRSYSKLRLSPHKSPSHLLPHRWLIRLVCSLSAALFATLVRQWVRSHMQAFPVIQSPFEASAVSTIFFRGRLANSGDGCSSPFVDPRLARPIIF